jgi:beta-N-acetylhexosaminidase
MTGHLYLKQWDGTAMLPATLSPRMSSVLRNDIGFTGVIMSDDLQMKAIDARYTLEEAAVAAVRAGNNILLYSNYAEPMPDLPAEVTAVLKRYAGEDPDFRVMIEESYRKIIALKARLRHTGDRLRDTLVR